MRVQSGESSPGTSRVEFRSAGCHPGWAFPAGAGSQTHHPGCQSACCHPAEVSRVLERQWRCFGWCCPSHLSPGQGRIVAPSTWMPQPQFQKSEKRPNSQANQALEHLGSNVGQQVVIQVGLFQQGQVESCKWAFSCWYNQRRVCLQAVVGCCIQWRKFEQKPIVSLETM